MYIGSHQGTTSNHCFIESRNLTGGIDWIKAWNFYIGENAFKLSNDEAQLVVGANFGSTNTDAGLIKLDTTDGTTINLAKYENLIIYGVSPSGDNEQAYVAG